MVHLLFLTDEWTETLRIAFEANIEAVAGVVYTSSDQDWYSLRELAMAMAHSAPEALAKIVQGWKPDHVAENLLKSRPEQFESIRWLLSSIRNVSPEWLAKLGEFLPWERYRNILKFVDKGDIESLATCFGVFRSLRLKLLRSMLRAFSEAIKDALVDVSLGDLRLSPIDTDIMLLTLFFPDDARAAFEAIDAAKLGSELNRSLPRDWRELLELSGLARQCGSDLPAKVISACDLLLVERQAYRFGRDDPYEFRLLLHFLRYAPKLLHCPLAQDMLELVRATCVKKDSEAKSILAAYARLDHGIARDLAQELGIEPDYHKEEPPGDSLEESRQEFRERDKSGEDYEIEL